MSEATNIESLCTVVVCNSCCDVNETSLRPFRTIHAFTMVVDATSMTDALRNPRIPHVGSTYNGKQVVEVNSESIGKNEYKITGYVKDYLR